MPFLAVSIYDMFVVVVHLVKNDLPLNIFKVARMNVSGRQGNWGQILSLFQKEG